MRSSCLLSLCLLVSACGVEDDAASDPPGTQGSTGVAGSTSGAPELTSSTDPATTTGVATSTTDPTATGTTTATSEPGYCGNGVLDEYESCDDGEYNADDAACTTACRFAVCGDGLVHAGFEACDDGNTFNTDACLNGCIVASCGDGFRGPGEACDDGNAVDDDECPNSCSGGGCGDGFVQVGEQCDDGNLEYDDACLNTCMLATCGDGFMQAGVEECDDANTLDSDTCSNTCKKPTCSDGARNGFETDVDCGGVYCDGCLLGEKCNGNLDCGDGICKANERVPPLPLEPPNCAGATVGVDQAYGAVKQSCGCHGGGAGGLTFTSASDFRNNMVGVNSQTAAMKIVTAGDIHQSYLIYKILNQHSKVVGGRGNPMPLGKSLSDSQKCLLINWIESGAK